MSAALLEIEGLAVEFATDRGPLRAVDGVSLAVPAGRTLGLVGESGSGKSVTAMSVIGLLGPNARVSGSVRFAGGDVLGLPAEELRKLRGGRIGMVFQDPGAALDPFHRIGDSLREAILAHKTLSASDLDARVMALLRDVGIPAPEERRRAYPHQLSGGMRQRVMIALALACDPQLLIADEPTTALDVTVQAQVIDLLKRLQAQRGMSILLITHDLGLVADSCDHVAVMYAGNVVEHGPTAAVLASPRHPYTAGLLASTPRGDAGGKLREIPGIVPDVRALPPGCRFQDRCPYVQPACKTAEPPLTSLTLSGAPPSLTLSEAPPSLTLSERSESKGVRAHRCLFPLGETA